MSNPQPKQQPKSKGVRAVVKSVTKSVEETSRKMAETIDRIRAQANKLGVA